MITNPQTDANEIIEDVLGDAYRAVILLVLNTGGVEMSGGDLVSTVRQIADRAGVPVEEREVRNRVRGLIRRGLLEGDEGRQVKLTTLGSRVAEKIAH